MLLKFKNVLVVLALALGVVNTACTDDEAKTEEPVQTAPAATEPAAAPEASAFTPDTVYFAYDDYTLNSDSQGKLQKLADHLKAAQTAVVQVEGHCDERGSIEYNLALGERRAQSVKNYLSQLGVDGSRLSTISYGEEKPATDGHDEAAWGKNRRAEFTITTNQ